MLRKIGIFLITSVELISWPTHLVFNSTVTLEQGGKYHYIFRKQLNTERSEYLYSLTDKKNSLHLAIFCQFVRGLL